MGPGYREVLGLFSVLVNRQDAKYAKKFKTKLNISYELACADEFFSYLA